MDLKTKLGAGVVSAAIALVAAWEGRSLITYVDPVGIPTICDGYTQGVKLGDTASPARCDALTEQEVRRALAVVDRSVSYPLPDEVRVALSSFVYNVGAGAYANSTLLRKLRAQDIAGACRELDRWVYAGGRKLRGLERRRQAERQLCLLSLH
ncbi:lysozyme [Alcaligenes faecalis]|uniref:lysozyme n=1 Tax=Alcaligenes faecalis TaxID=511 RepID=UPI0024BCDADC|nr:lysozyme [Alcaligenes faecalis]WHQ44496.1 lysozyme [Alcaligenes faecalis]